MMEVIQHSLVAVDTNVVIHHWKGLNLQELPVTI